MTLRIAFCGPDSELNDRLARNIYDLLSNEVVESTILPSPHQELMEYIHRDNLHGLDIDSINLWALVQRRMMEERVRGQQLIISPTFGLDQLALQAAFVQEQINHAESGLVVADATGQQKVMEESFLQVHKSGSALQVMVNQAEEELEYYDFIYATIPLIAGMTKAPDFVLNQYNDFMDDSASPFQVITKLPNNETGAMDILNKDIDKWKEKIKSS